MKNVYHVLYETLARSLVVSMMQEDEHFDRALLEGRTSLLLEKFTNDDAKDLASAISSMSASVDKVIAAIGEKMKNTKALLEKEKGKLNSVKSSEIASLSMKGDTKALKSKITELNKNVTTIGNITAAVVQTLINAADNLEDVKFDNDKATEESTKQAKSITFAEMEKDKTNPFYKEEVLKIMKSVLDTFKTPTWQTSAVEKGVSSVKSSSGGLFGKIIDFFKGMKKKSNEDVSGEAKDAFKKDLGTLSITAIIEMKPSLESAKAELAEFSKQLAGKSAGATVDTAPKPNDGSKSPGDKPPDQPNAPGGGPPSGGDEGSPGGGAPKSGGAPGESPGGGEGDGGTPGGGEPGGAPSGGKVSRREWPKEFGINVRKANKKRLDKIAAFVNAKAGKDILESRRRAHNQDTILVERWARLAGIKDED